MVNEIEEKLTGMASETEERLTEGDANWVVGEAEEKRAGW